ncbi:hypothetical protein PTSG_04144 [Salpingoeca rosetta]|uniref:Uncharacterized protein n=1 Tax=Salpingoeca rosetta (strain ATCC 50818 / BSB-021) TaxID=946362 RepID=F2U6Q7_SALR5|nr:uncharacterized protein PTSG_04144 [Salpingoeca rosetta]EGD83539.1 hypothetical protein PTSG_04144 [Salpingoeca rosetta]|eukprot:XP_004995043.1 hypothetical protein PTSG_04144 [Salpingoeca rosetta]
MQGGEALEALLSAEAEVSRLQQQLANLDAAIDACNEEMVSVTGNDALVVGGGSRQMSALSARSDSISTASSTTRRRATHMERLAALRCDDTNQLSARIKEVDRQLDAIRAKRRQLAEQGLVDPSSAAALRITWSRPTPILLASKRTLLPAQELRLEHIRAKKHALDRLHQRPSLPNMSRAAYPKWQRPTYDFVRSIVTSLLDDLLDTKVLDIPPDVNANYDSAIAAAQHLKVSWWLAKELEEEVISEACRSVAGELIALRDFVHTQVRVLMRSSVASAPSTAPAEPRSNRLDQVIDAMLKARSRSFYCIKHSQSVAFRRRADTTAATKKKKTVTLHPAAKSDTEDDVEALEDSEFVQASQDGLYPVEYTYAGAPSSPASTTTSPTNVLPLAPNWTRDPSREWRAAFAQSLDVTFSPSRKFACLLSQRDLVVIRFDGGKFGHTLTHDPVHAKPIFVSWAENEQSFLVLHDDSSLSLWTFNTTAHTRSCVAITIAQMMKLPTSFDGLTLMPIRCHFLPSFSLLGDQTHALVMFANGDMLPIALPSLTSPITPAPTTPASRSTSGTRRRTAAAAQSNSNNGSGVRDDGDGGGDGGEQTNRGDDGGRENTGGDGAERLTRMPRRSSISISTTGLKTTRTSTVGGPLGSRKATSTMQQQQQQQQGNRQSVNPSRYGTLSRTRGSRQLANHLCRAHRHDVMHYHWGLRGLVTLDRVAHLCMWQLDEEFLTGFGWYVVRPSKELSLQLCRLQAWPKSKPVTKFSDSRRGSKRNQTATRRQRALEQFAAMNMPDEPWIEETHGSTITRTFRPANVQQGDFTCALLTFKNKTLIKFQTQQFSQQNVICNKIIGTVVTNCRKRVVIAALFSECFQLPSEIVVFMMDLEQDVLYRMCTIPVDKETYNFCINTWDSGQGVHLLKQDGDDLPDVLVHAGKHAYVCRLHNVRHKCRAFACLVPTHVRRHFAHAKHS